MPSSFFPRFEYKGISHQQKTALLLVSKYAEGFLRFAPRTIRNYPSHGVDHSVSIIKMINDFTEKWEIKLSKTERFILYSAAWLHDIGCVKDRSPHNLISVEIIFRSDLICDTFNGMENDLLFILEDVIKSHSSSYDIASVPEKRGAVRVRLISAIFRLLDACEITNFKCPAPVYAEIKDDLKNPDNSPDTEAIGFWEGHMNIKDIGFSKPNIEIIVNNSRKTRNIVDRLKTEIESIKAIFEENEIVVPVIQERTKQAGIDK